MKLQFCWGAKVCYNSGIKNYRGNAKEYVWAKRRGLIKKKVS